MTSQNKAYFILFLEGLASSGLQVTAIRQTTPFVGSSITSTSIIIAVFLAALALGYYRGGKVPNTQYQNRLCENLLLATVIFGIGLSYGFISLFFTILDVATSGIPVISTPLLHLTVYCLLVIAPLVFLLAQTVPLLLNTAKDLSHSEAAGNYTAISTLGNVVGCVTTSLLVMYFLGVSASIIINCTLLAICAYMTAPQQRSQRLAKTLCAGFFVLIAGGLNAASSFWFEAESAYSNIRVFDTSAGKVMNINNSMASYIGNKKREGWPYIEFIKTAIFNDDVAGKDILVLGAGGFTLTSNGDHGANVMYVDIDVETRRVAEESFLGLPIIGKFTAEDARRYLLTSNKEWDYIVVDVYSDASSIPAHTASLEFFELVSSRLKPSGRAILNIVASPQLTDSYSMNMDNTVRRAFPFCVTHLSGYEKGLENILYLCRKQVSERDVAVFYFDDTTRVDIEGFVANRQTD